jgi:hypothetical protein
MLSQPFTDHATGHRRRLSIFKGCARNPHASAGGAAVSNRVRNPILKRNGQAGKVTAGAAGLAEYRRDQRPGGDRWDVTQARSSESLPCSTATTARSSGGCLNSELLRRGDPQPDNRMCRSLLPRSRSDGRAPPRTREDTAIRSTRAPSLAVVKTRNRRSCENAFHGARPSRSLRHKRKPTKRGQTSSAVHSRGANLVLHAGAKGRKSEAARRRSFHHAHQRQGLWLGQSLRHGCGPYRQHPGTVTLDHSLIDAAARRCRTLCIRPLRSVLPRSCGAHFVSARSRTPARARA